MADDSAEEASVLADAAIKATEIVEEAPQGEQETAAALREDQIQNAISFLSHPKVQGSTEASKTSFLERKGLTKVEIDEAFRRVSTQGTGNVGSVLPSATPNGLPPRKPYQGTQDTITALQPRSGLQMRQPPQTLKWTQVVLGASVIVAGAYALKQLLGPYATRVYRRWYGSESDEGKTAEEKKTADIVAAAIESQTKELRSTVESLKDMLVRLEKGKHIRLPPAEAGLSVDDLRSELHAFAATFSEGSRGVQADSELKTELAQIKSLLSRHNPEKTTPRKQSSTYSPYSGPNGSSSVAPPASRAFHSQDSHPQDSAADGSTNGHQPSYMEVLEMLERGETPPNVRTDINDKPPNPTQAPPNSRFQPKPKPWERTQHSSSPLPNGNGNAAEGTPHTVIQEIDPPNKTPSKAPTGPWKPPARPQASISYKNAAAESAAQESGGEEDNAVIQNEP